MTGTLMFLYFASPLVFAQGADPCRTQISQAEMRRVVVQQAIVDRFAASARRMQNFIAESRRTLSPETRRAMQQVERAVQQQAVYKARIRSRGLAPSGSFNDRENALRQEEGRTLDLIQRDRARRPLPSGISRLPTADSSTERLCESISLADQGVSPPNIQLCYYFRWDNFSGTPQIPDFRITGAIDGQPLPEAVGGFYPRSRYINGQQFLREANIYATRLVPPVVCQVAAPRITVAPPVPRQPLRRGFFDESDVGPAPELMPEPGAESADDSRR